MKTKTYTVTVMATYRKSYRITAKGALKAKKEAELKFRNSHGTNWFNIEAHAVADWVKKEE